MEIFFTSTVISAIVAACVAAWTAHRKISIENITQDRRAWREKVREKALSVHDALISKSETSLNRLRAEFALLLNPKDPLDQEIIACITIPDDGPVIERANEFAERIALLLKHDWERAKLEVSPCFMRVKGVRKLIDKFNIVQQADREKYEKRQ